MQTNSVTELWKSEKKMYFGAYICPLMTPVQMGMLDSTFFKMILGKGGICFVQFLDFIYVNSLAVFKNSLYPKAT